MRTLGNILWLVLGGFWLAVAYVMAGLVNVVLIITIPFGVQSFKLAGYALWPFGRVVVDRPDRSVGLSTLGNVIWLIFGGLWLALAHVFVGLVMMITVVGFPLGVASFKMAGLAIAPFGRQIVSLEQARRMGAPILIDFHTDV